LSFYTRFAAHYEQIFPFRPATLDFLRARLPAGGRVLDLGCGTGHYTGALAAAGLEAIGLDLDAAMIEAARRRYTGALFAVADLGEVRTICPDADGAFCIGNVLPHLPPDGLRALLADLAAVLPDGAPWIVQTVNFDRLLPLRAAHDLPELTAGGGLVFRRRYEPQPDGSLRFSTALAQGAETVFAGETVLWPLPSGELAAAHARAGFALAEQLGGFGGEAFVAAASGGCVQVYRRQLSSISQSQRGQG
jgi:glycine/sarcosine N-methyltransferase